MHRLRWIALLCFAALAMPLSAGPENPLTRVATIRGLSREDAAKALLVKFTGVVTYVGWENFVVHDGETSIFADFRFSKAKGHWCDEIPDLTKLKPGDGVEVEGLTDPGGFSPMVLVTKFRRIGRQVVPPPLRPSTDLLLSGSQDTQWIEVEGVIRNHNPNGPGPELLTVIVAGHRCPVIFRDHSGLVPAQLVDARVRIRGVLLNIANLRSQVAGLKIHSNGRQDIDILAPPPADPFHAPRVSLDRLIPFDPGADFGHRRVSSGLVTFVAPGRFIYLHDRGANVRVDSDRTDLSPGDLVEVAGFIDTERVLASFSEALVRVTGKGPVPPPAPADIPEILEPKVRSYEEMVAQHGYTDANGRLVRLHGTLRRVLPADKDGNATLVVESGEHLVQAFVPIVGGDDSRTLDRWTEGSSIELTGVSELDMARIDKQPWFSIAGFHLWLSSPAGLRVVSEPPWWTPQRLAIILAGVLLALGLVFAWGYAMRRQVALRSGQLAREIAAREAATLEFDAILRERRRLANDLHDTLEQALTGLALQLEITERSKSSNPELSARHLNLAQQFLDRSRREVHRTVWDLRAHGLDGRDVIDVLHERAAAMVDGTPVAITVAREGSTGSLPDLLAGNLLLLAQEAVTNALKHGDPTSIEMRLKALDHEIELQIRDDGRGFDPAAAPGQLDGHFGLQGMHERAKRIGGTLEVTSKPGRGTSITVLLPLPSAT
jgi:signal transduction histidine kinase